MFKKDFALTWTLADLFRRALQTSKSNCEVVQSLQCWGTLRDKIPWRDAFEEIRFLQETVKTAFFKKWLKVIAVEVATCWWQHGSSIKVSSCWLYHQYCSIIHLWVSETINVSMQEHILNFRIHSCPCTVAALHYLFITASRDCQQTRNQEFFWAGEFSWN